MNRAAAVTAVVLGLLCLCSAQVVQNTLQDPKITGGACSVQYRQIIAAHYATANLTSCSALITTALNTTVKSQCPPSAIGSPVQQCMNTTKRAGSGESEEGFTYKDNSCFPIFNSFNDFSSWLYGRQIGSSAAGMRVAYLTVLAALALFGFVMW
ncbi:hypothetical protein QJQ45_009269 [Haematococcus lacustris]|nr:hypothetical protein QJQ45_009269 [Haematococcus lacustris]